MTTPFTNKERQIMREANVPYDVAYHRHYVRKWTKERAMTEPLHYGKGRRKAKA